ncbi:MAG: PaaI family thioesterase [Peptococcaceae bacterium]|nr:PaaI family thioesterase [Peptococcaceae bacterium]
MKASESYSDRKRDDQDMDERSLDLPYLREFFAADRFARQAGITIDAVREDCVECSMPVTPEHLNAGGAVQGGAVYTLADMAFAVHANLDWAYGAPIGITVSTSCAISFLKSSQGARLYAQTACVSRGRNMSVYRVTIYDDLGVCIAEMVGNGYTTPQASR